MDRLPLAKKYKGLKWTFQKIIDLPSILPIFSTSALCFSIQPSPPKTNMKFGYNLGLFV